MSPQSKRPRTENDSSSSVSITDLKEEISKMHEVDTTYYASRNCALPQLLHAEMPMHGMPARHVQERVLQQSELDNRPRLNTSSYVNVVQEPEEEAVALLGLKVNLADGSVYPASVRLHDTVVNMIAKLWNCPVPEDGSNYSGTGTVGSTEACLLAGLALKFRWRIWYQKKFNKTQEEVMGVVPNIVISSCYQAAWEKFFRYFDVVPRFIKPELANAMRIDPSKVKDLCDERTIGVVGILGNHYNGAYDPVWDIDEVLETINLEKGYEIGLHIDAASGGFIAPFQDGLPPFDFRLKNVLSISTSGHKFGESCCGTGWLVFRHRHDLAEHIAVSVTYLGGKSDSITLNFSRPASGPYVQYYKFLRLGQEGYRRKVAQQMKTTKFLRDKLRSATLDGKPRFEIVDAGDEHCLPVVAARLNPALLLKYTDVDVQHAVAESHWYVCGYALTFEDFGQGGRLDTLCTDVKKTDTMFRIVVKSNLTMSLAEDLIGSMMVTLPVLDELKGGYTSVKKFASTQLQKSGKHGQHSVC